MVISHRIVINKDVIARDGRSIPSVGITTPEELYTRLEFSYPKFYKMDKLCKWAWLGAKYLLADGALYKDLDREKVAVVMATAHGCLDVDKRFQETIQMPSPALFVYTLPNIMLGEICIRHGFKGEQFCMVNDVFDATELYFAVSQLLKNSHMDACLCGWANATDGNYDVRLFWVTKTDEGAPFTPGALDQS